MSHLNIGICCANQPEQSISPQVGNGNHGQAGKKGTQNSSASASVNFFRLTTPQRNTQSSGGSITKE